MTAPSGNTEFSFPSTSIFPTVSGKQNSLLPLWLVIKCLLFKFRRHLCKGIYLSLSVLQWTAGGKKSSVLTSSKQVRKGFKIRQLFSLKMTLNIHEKGFTISKTIPVCKKWKKCEPFCVSKLLFLRQKWIAGVRHGNLFVVSSSIAR